VQLVNGVFEFHVSFLFTALKISEFSKIHSAFNLENIFCSLARKPQPHAPQLSSPVPTVSANLHTFNNNPKQNF
jgi:hypothetical protein